MDYVHEAKVTPVRDDQPQSLAAGSVVAESLGLPLETLASRVLGLPTASKDEEIIPQIDASV